MQLSSGTTDRSEFARRNVLLTRIAKIGLAELLQAFVSGEIGIDDLLRFDREENLRNGLQELRRVREQELDRLAGEQPRPALSTVAAAVASDLAPAATTGPVDRTTMAHDALTPVPAVGIKASLHRPEMSPVETDAERPEEAERPVSGSATPDSSTPHGRPRHWPASCGAVSHSMRTSRFPSCPRS